MSETPTSPQSLPRRWQPLSAIDRRVAGVLAEKAKTTPDAYPMSLNAVCTGCNQKSNRDPVMQLEPADVEESLDRLRELGAVGIVEGFGRVARYRHYLYDWLGVEKVELSVMTELLLRGDQTEGELRTRASRMDPIPDLPALRNVLNGLMAKELVVSLTPEGRGHVVTHNLYKPREMEVLRVKYSGAAPAAAAPGSASSSYDIPPTSSSSESVRRDLELLRAEAAQLRTDMELLKAMHDQTAEEVRRLKEALGA
ncbi:MAG: DUF480 domain-containing protein [Pirellulales bacterium]|nr:DUF480 domain-containing protein [Pirellulales bacterium]